MHEHLSAQNHVSETETIIQINKLKVVDANCLSIPSKKSCYNNMVDFYLENFYIWGC